MHKPQPQCRHLLSTNFLECRLFDFRPSEGRVQPPSLPSVLWWLGKFCEVRVLERGPIRAQIETDLTHTSEPVALIFEMSFERVHSAQGLQFIIAANPVRWTET